MACVIYLVDLELSSRRPVGSISIHTKMSNWLKTNGDKQYIYELWKVGNIHSRWIWSIKRKRWGRMATPSKKDII